MNLTANGEFLACGYSKYSDDYLPRAGWLFRFNASGDSLWYRDYFYYPEVPWYGINYLYDVSETEDNGFITTGQASTFDPPNNIQKMWVLKVDSVGCEIENCWVGIEEQGGGEAWERGSGEAGRHGDLEVWPNPASGVLSVKCLGLNVGISYSLSVVDIFGRAAPTPALRQLGRGRRSWMDHQCFVLTAWNLYCDCERWKYGAGNREVRSNTINLFIN